ncbi:MAG: methionine--tRNA ligase subunit beta [Candidatus Sungbacteria bacterium RIFCSPHIGHO2_02_FULL_49_12]|uniref:Methionine--tRNA ligase n=1 Tax=Candidatus Sungbacteria bacterium RIFCSPHIGHO2_02_FULL_49_12 TaxID=1802271 RepID=A0A1G2KQT0_9BACT|nr:MAG: methionine--tRNA ligase subunit beta [Candidatus Sungbacteria bacterium RIFCSPHIGHO2_02_FULL_49_12]
MITIDEFKRAEMRVGKITAAERVNGSDKLLKLRVDLGVEIGERQILAGVGKQYQPENLLGRYVAVVANLEPRMLMGFESQGMMLAASDGETIAILSPDLEKDIKPGALVH